MTTLRLADRGRLKELLPIRYGRMAASPFAFFRGAAPVMVRDLAATPTTGLRVQLAGDAHLSNFGVFGTPERDAVFDVNDFDETLPGPWEWDLKRLTTSLVIAAQQNRLGRGAGRRAALTAARSYRVRVRQFASMGCMEVWYSHLDPAEGARDLSAPARQLIDRAVGQAWGKTNAGAFPKMARVLSRGKARIREVPPLIRHYAGAAAVEESHRFFDRYVATLPEERRMLLDRYEVADVAQKVVGVGSVGTACSVILLLGDGDVDDPLFLQLKEARASALEPYLAPSVYPNHAQRVVVGQHLIQEASDVFLGWSRLRGRDFYVRQLRDLKFSNSIEAMGPRELSAQAELCGNALARAHARTGDPSAISGYLGGKPAFDSAVVQFAEAYADQNRSDYRALQNAIRSGAVPCEPEP